MYLIFLQYVNLCESIRQAIPLLKDIFLDIQVNSQAFPFVGTIELTTFCEMIQIVDENFKIANIDLLFVSTVVLQRG